MLFERQLLVSVGELFSIVPAIETDNGTCEGIGFTMPFFGITFLIIGGVLLVIGIANMVMSYGLLKGRGWAYNYCYLNNNRNCYSNNL